VIAAQADAMRLPLADHTVDLIVTSPPYYGVRAYAAGGIGEEATPAAYIEALIAATREMVRVLRPSGSIWVNLGDKFVSDNRGSGPDRRRGPGMLDAAGPAGYPGQGFAPRKSLMLLPARYATRCVDDLGLILRRDIIWSKPNARPEPVLDRCQSSHEYWYHLVTQPRYFANADAIPGGSVWVVPIGAPRLPPGLVEHWAAFPEEFPRRIILAWSPPGGTVLDPFGGTGVTAAVADALGRHGISVDLAADYSQAAAWRGTDPKLRAKVAA
jgi:DNA modification methylase